MVQYNYQMVKNDSQMIRNDHKMVLNDTQMVIMVQNVCKGVPKDSQIVSIDPQMVPTYS